jgi:uncharacterized iron-regulated membrane protein
LSLLRTLVHHPRRLLLRRVAFQVHLWLGILLSLYITLIALSGALLVYHDALTRIVLPAGLHRWEPTHTASVPQVMAAAQARFPHSTVSYLDTPKPQLPVFLLQLTDPSKKLFSAVADPQTGHVLLLPRDWVDVVYDFHVDLLLGLAHGVQWNGVGAAGLLLLAVTGVLLWWRGLRSWWRGLTVSLRHNWRRLNYDLHHAIGIWTLLLVSLWAISGVYFAWDGPFARVVGAVSPLAGMQPPVPRVAPAAHTHASLQQVLDTAQAASPHGRLSTLIGPSLVPGEDVYAYMNLRTPEDFAHADIVRLDANTGAILSVWHYGANHSAGDWFLWALEPLHFGTLWGPWVRALWCLCGLALAALSVSGVLMYWNRYLRFRWRELKTVSALTR